jgi:uncharacterized protein (TIGR02246 family)
MNAPSMVRARGRAKRGLLALVLALAGVCAGACASAYSRDRAGSDQPFVLEIGERNRHLEEQFRRGNLLGVADLYADDAVLLDSQGGRHEGRAEIDAYWTRIEAPRDWRLESRRVFGSDTLAYELGRSHLTTIRDGQEHTSVVDFLLLWRREVDGQWKIVLDAYWPLPR